MTTAPEVLAETEARMHKSVEALTRELTSIRTGRASPALVDSITVDYYGVPTPMNQLASISVPEARVLMITPWDKQSMKEVEKSLMKSDLGLVPNNDGSAIRINIPTLTEERRRDLVKIAVLPALRVEDTDAVSVHVHRAGGLVVGAFGKYLHRCLTKPDAVARLALAEYRPFDGCHGKALVGGLNDLALFLARLGGV